MPVPTSFDDLSETPSSNSPQGSEPVGTQANEYIQAAFAFIKQLYDGFTPINTLTAPVGTRLVMQQATAPAGWTIDASAAFTDVAMRFNQSVTTGGTNVFSTFNTGSTFATSGTALSVAQLPAHTHGTVDPGHSHGVNDGGHTHGVNDPGHIHQMNGTDTSPGNYPGFIGPGVHANGSLGTNSSPTGISLASSGTGIGIQGNATGLSISSTGSGATHSHNVTYAPQVKYADCIVAIKS